ncbi:VOC family protein [Actinoplanes sp. NPDC051861]|uniref:VOC family protein n=1 Tax=Actinoplanes sp. NPDC051861 TaxID=3155170 RepID=UPI0034294863
MAQISLGVADAQRAGEFWMRALGWVRRPPRWDGDDWFVVEPPPGGRGTPIALDVSESPAPEFPRIHLDLTADGDLAAEVARLVGLGAQRVDWPFYPPPTPGEKPFVVLADTEGNRFCVEG